MLVLGLDPSTRCGIALVNEDKVVVHSAEIHFPKLEGFPRAQAIIAEIMEVYEGFQPDHVVIEEMFVGHASSAIPIIQLGSLIRYFLWQEGIKYLEVSPTVLKKFVANGGQAKKEEMMMYVLKNWGHQSKTNNTADAVGLGMFGQCAYKGALFPKQQTEVVAKALLPKAKKPRKK